MKKISFIAMTLLAVTGCKNETKETTRETKTEAATPKIDSPAAKAAVVENTNTDSKEIPTLKECTEKTVEYGSEQECLFPKSTMVQVYEKTIKAKELEKSELLLAELPKQSVEKEINQDGLDAISYKVSANTIEIEFLFAGGVTTLKLEQKGENVKRTIIHSAD
ncbi:hypothetical protein [Chryseobacterium viscerum]|uniref:Uncharacterized protein n=1 Tax=Chryseobacterium viscerum TaxID=1037377 RepID=A0A316WMT4_9FLAO|nr:hypothetical protein [Chryseobacterium viscerum]PWN59810.1 hypothetical protein C1634_017455 [Chryseobacterium viscerum]